MANKIKLSRQNVVEDGVPTVVYIVTIPLSDIQKTPISTIAKKRMDMAEKNPSVSNQLKAVAQIISDVEKEYGSKK